MASRHEITLDPAGINISGKTVEVVVGEEETPFSVHENVLRSRSPFFEAALRKCWQEGRDGRIELPEDSPEIAEIYFQFLYSSSLYIEWTRDSSTMQLHENLPEYRTLALLYVFGEKVRDIIFKNAVMDCFIKRMNERVGNRGWSPVGEVVDIIYDGTMPGSPARQLMLDCHFYKGLPHWISDKPESNNKEFLMDLTRMLLRSRKPLQTNPPFANAMKDYHEGTKLKTESPSE